MLLRRSFASEMTEQTPTFGLDDRERGESLAASVRHTSTFMHIGASLTESVLVQTFVRKHPWERRIRVTRITYFHYVLNRKCQIQSQR